MPMSDISWVVWSSFGVSSCSRCSTAPKVLGSETNCELRPRFFPLTRLPLSEGEPSSQLGVPATFPVDGYVNVDRRSLPRGRHRRRDRGSAV